MDPQKPADGAPLSSIVAAFAVHIFTACGGACALLALISAVTRQWPRMFIWLGLALVIDGVDGTLARRLRVAELLPRWSGEVLDLVVDIMNYVFVPAYALTAAGLLPRSIAVPLGLLIVVTGSLYFADRRMKTADYYFRGFPALWNVAAFYLFVLKPAPWLGAFAVVALSVLTFIPIHFIHPLRASRARGVTMTMLVVWVALALLAVERNLDSGFWTKTILSILALYFVALGFLRRHHP